MSSTKLKVGDNLPSFSLKDQNGETFSIDKLIGNQSIIIYFYPKDETSVCTAQACLFRDNYQDFKDVGCEVIGISTDGEKSHKNFSVHHNLPFILLSDPQKEVRKLFDVPKDIFGLLPGRYTYVINKEGKIILIFNSAFSANKHIEAAKKALGL